MANITIIGPLDQPIGTRRLLDDLRSSLGSPVFTHFMIAVAFAKSGPLLRLKADLEIWKENGRVSEVIFGLDHQGTSREALEISLELFDNVYYTREPSITFHPKIYLFKGKTQGRCFIGSNNLTVGGTETNFETALCLDADLPTEASLFDPLEACWRNLLPSVCPATVKLTAAGLAKLVADGVVPNERTTYARGAGRGGGTGTSARASRSGLKIKPPSALPSSVLRTARPRRSASPTASAPARVPTAPPVAPPSSIAVQGFAIQIVPHPNGEIFLSVSAALQNPAFFKWPFSGRTTPKKPSNPSYPQLSPDPRVNITVYGAGGSEIENLPAYGLNTVYYERKSEIRITASPLVGKVDDFSVMVMRPGETPGIDYEITIHRTDSPDYPAWVAACNQVMPGGGGTPRKFGWF